MLPKQQGVRRNFMPKSSFGNMLFLFRHVESQQKKVVNYQRTEVIVNCLSLGDKRNDTMRLGGGLGGC